MLTKLCLLAAACLAQGPADRPLDVDSPNGRIRAEFRLDEKGAPTIQVSYGGEIVARAELGLALAEGGPIREGLEVVGSTTAERDETYKIPVGKTSTARDHHRELAVTLREKKEGGRGLGLVLRAFDDGLAFRYVLPDEGDFVLTDELTRLAFPGDPTARLLPLAGYTTSYENYYQSKKVSEIGPKDLAGVPMLLSRPGGPWIAVTEAALTDYAGMYLAGAEGEAGTLESRLSPLPGRTDGAKVIGRGPFETPWRVLMIAAAPGRLIESDLVFHLNPPSKIADPSWIRPGKTTFPWWNGYAMTGPVGFNPGVNTATMDHYIDFAAEAGIEYHSLDGLDIAWYGGPIGPVGPVDVTKAAPSLDLPEILARAKAKGLRIRLWMHWLALRPQIDEAFAAYEQWGVEGVMVDFMDRDDQEMVAFYHEMAEKAARHHLTLTLHGAYKPTGMERTWPNVLNYEAALNQEYNKWSPPAGLGTPPAHNLDIAFVRMLAGPLDYHQGGMRNVSPADFKPSDKAPPVQGTRGHQIGMYVVYQNHLPMMADDPGAYRGQPELPFVVSIPSTWDETRVPLAEPGRLIIVARRSGADWFLGGMAAGAGQEVEIPLDFLPPGDYKADLYVDNPAAGPTSVQRLDLPAERKGSLRLPVAADGGFAGRLTPIGKH